MYYDLTTLPNGLRVISEKMPSLRSIALGCWADTGARDETEREHGASHFLEHLLFKGSDSLTAREVSEIFDTLGAESNAFTSKEATCYWARFLDQDLEQVMNVFSEMIRRPAFRQNEIDAERQVVVEEINMNEDDPNDVAFENFSTALFAGHPLEMPVLGTRESIRAMTRDDIYGYWDRRYGAGSMVIAASGNVDHAKLVEMVSDRFGDWTGDEVPHEVSGLEPVENTVVTRRDTEQAHVILGGRGLVRNDDRRWAFEILNHIMGSGMSSRLFREVREERGLAYAVYGFRFAYADAGAWGVYVGTTPHQLETAMEVIKNELEKVASDGISEEELSRARSSMRGGLALALEDANSRMVRLGRDELARVEHLSVDERLRRLDAVTTDEVKTIAYDLYMSERVVGAVGPFEPGEVAAYAKR